jgi:N-dimethylarginine dimethylaminohydrolase
MKDRSGPLFQEYAALRRVAVCAPTFYQLRQPINVIQAKHLAAGGEVSSERAAAEHAELVEVLRNAGAEIVEVPANPRFAYQINTRDAGLGTPGGVVLGRFRVSARQGEEALVRQAVQAAGDRLLGTVCGAAFEGGDFVALDRGHAAVGLGARTEAGALEELRALLGPSVELIGVPFEARYLHLDMILNVIGERLALACPAALPSDFVHGLQQDGFRLLEISDEEVFGHGCNVLALGSGRIISHRGNKRVNDLLRADGFHVTVVGVSELAKSGGGPRCLTLPIERDP